ncbi:MAG: hypothetical protein RBG13Loki_3338 [Promethearchaeota archaeon CR_4]|nr:MAG: hypothetical protein RBG13Loki_3338 [Candidatus Lokiarchaeota archaeon CR_4]
MKYLQSHQWSSLTTLFPIKLTCPLCESKFTSQEIGSYGFATKRTDFRPNYWGFNPTEYFFHLCPKCRFCASKNYFEKDLTNIDLKQKIAAIGPLENYNLSEKLNQAAKCLEVIRDSDLETLTDFNLANVWRD